MSSILPTYHIGHFVGQPQRPLDFEITRFEQMGELDIEDPHQHAFYEILWFEAGHSTQVIDYQEYEIFPNTLFFISPHQAHHFVEYQPLKGGSIFFTENFFRLGTTDPDRLLEVTFLDNFYTHPMLVLDDTNFASVKTTIELLWQERQHPLPSPIIQQSLLQVLLAQIQRLVDQHTSELSSRRYLVTYKRFNQLLDQHFANGRKANWYAQQLHLTPHHLNTITKSVTGKTTTALIQSRTMLEAKRYLTFTDLDVSEIAERLGFTDLAYFSRVFRKITQTSPMKFRKEISEKYRNL